MYKYMYIYIYVLQLVVVESLSPRGLCGKNITAWLKLKITAQRKTSTLEKKRIMEIMRINTSLQVSKNHSSLNTSDPSLSYLHSLMIPSPTSSQPTSPHHDLVKRPSCSLSLLLPQPPTQSSTQPPTQPQPSTQPHPLTQTSTQPQPQSEIQLIPITTPLQSHKFFPIRQYPMNGKYPSVCSKPIIPSSLQQSHHHHLLKHVYIDMFKANSSTLSKDVQWFRDEMIQDLKLASRLIDDDN